MAVVLWDAGYNKTLTIASGQTESDVLHMAGTGARRKMDLMLRAPATLPEVVTIHISESPTGTFAPLNQGGIDVTLTTGKAVVVDGIIAAALKLVADGAAGGNRAVVIQGNSVA